MWCHSWIQKGSCSSQALGWRHFVWRQSRRSHVHPIQFHYRRRICARTGRLPLPECLHTSSNIFKKSNHILLNLKCNFQFSWILPPTAISCRSCYGFTVEHSTWVAGTVKMTGSVPVTSSIVMSFWSLSTIVWDLLVNFIPFFFFYINY